MVGLPAEGAGEAGCDEDFLPSLEVQAALDGQGAPNVSGDEELHLEGSRRVCLEADRRDHPIADDPNDAGEIEAVDGRESPADEDVAVGFSEESSCWAVQEDGREGIVDLAQSIITMHTYLWLRRLAEFGAVSPTLPHSEL